MGWPHLRILSLTSEDYARHTGGWVYDSRLVEALRAQGADVAEIAVPVGFPTMSDDGRTALARAFADLPDEAFFLADHLHVADIAPMLRGVGFRVVSIFHHSRVIEAGVLAAADERARELAGFAVADVVVVSSPETARYIVAQYGVEEGRIIVAIPGNDPFARATPDVDHPLQILSVGALVPRKRQDYLVEVASRLQPAGWCWTLVGDPDRDAAWTAQIASLIRSVGLADRMQLAGTISPAELELLWAQASIYVAASHYEGYGMAIAEALRHGVPVVTTPSGAVADWAARGAVFAPEDDTGAFAAIVGGLIADPARRLRLADEAWAFGVTLPTWQQTFADIPSRIVQALMPVRTSSAA